jgi:hypothetical protein
VETPQIQLDADEIIAEPQGGELDSQVEAETTDSASSTEEANAEVQTSDEEPSEDNETDSDDQSDEASDDEDSTDETQTDEPKKRSAQERIRQLASEKRALQEQVKELNQRAYQVPTAEQLMDDGMDEATARVTALEQRQQLAEFNAQVADVSNSISTESLQVMADYPMFDPDSKSFNPELTALADQVYQQAAGIQTDPKTNLIYDVKVLPYQVYESIAKAYSSGASTGQVKAQRSAEKMLAAADTPTSVAPKQPKDDPFLKGFNL